MHRACAQVALLLVATVPASANGITIVGGSPRAIGRAGTSAVGDDGGGALLINPGAIARRDDTRVQVGVTVIDDAVTWAPDAADAPIARDQAGSRAQPVAAVIGALGAWVVGAGVMTAGVAAHALRDPRDVADPTDLGARFEYRYSGIAGRVRRDTLAIAVARRLGDAVALGGAFGASRIAVDETRRLWAGLGEPIGDPGHDVQLALSGHDGFVPSATVGVLAAPFDAAVELGASVAWTGRTEIDGDVAADGPADGPSVHLSTPRAALGFRHPIVARAGARYLGAWLVAELGGELWLAPGSAEQTAWSIAGARVEDPSGAVAELTTVPSRLSLRSHGAVRGAVDVELLAGFLWATAGYAYRVGGTTPARLSPSLGDLGGHTLALGVEAAAGGFTCTLGWSRTLTRARRGGAALALDNPFDGGDAAVPGGRYDGSTDQLGALLEISLD